MKAKTKNSRGSREVTVQKYFDYLSMLHRVKIIQNPAQSMKKHNVNGALITRLRELGYCGKLNGSRGIKWIAPKPTIENARDVLDYINNPYNTHFNQQPSIAKETSLPRVDKSKVDNYSKSFLVKASNANRLELSILWGLFKIKTS